MTHTGSQGFVLFRRLEKESTILGLKRELGVGVGGGGGWNVGSGGEGGGVGMRN